MKKNTTLRSFAGLFLGGVLTLSGCSLAESPKDQIPEAEAYQSSTLIYLNTVASLYNDVGSGGGGWGLAGTDRNLYDLNTFTSDEALLPTRGGDWFDGGLWQDLYRHAWTGDNDIIKGTWDYLYGVIGKTNRSLDKLTSLQTEDPENEALGAYIAELRAFRAMYYTYAMDLFGNIPLVTKGSEQISDVKQSSRPDVYAFVITELQEALPMLSDANSTKPGEYYGRMTKPVALFLLAKLALNANVYADADWTDGNTGTYSFSVDGQTMSPYDAVVYYADQITALGYTLEGDFAHNFAVNNEDSKENIFVIPMDPTTYNARNMMIVRSSHYEFGKAWGQDGWNGASATKEAMAVFRKGGDDPRLEMTYYTGAVFGPDGSPVMNGTEPLVYEPDAIALDVSGTPAEKTAGARMKKYELDPTAQASGQLVHNDLVLFRYADVLLMRSEALVRAGKNGDDDLNAVRSRVGATARTATLETLLDERMLELAWEGHRRNDLVRFGKYTAPVSDRPATPAATTVFPIPNEVINLNSNLTQNPGY